MLRWFERHQVYHPERAMVTTGSELGRPFEDELLLEVAMRIEESRGPFLGPKAG